MAMKLFLALLIAAAAAGCASKQPPPPNIVVTAGERSTVVLGNLTGTCIGDSMSMESRSVTETHAAPSNNQGDRHAMRHEEATQER